MGTYRCKEGYMLYVICNISAVYAEIKGIRVLFTCESPWVYLWLCTCVTIPPPTGGARGGRLLQEGFFAKQSGRSTSGLATEGTQESRARGGHHRLFMLVFLRRTHAYNNVEMLFVTFVTFVTCYMLHIAFSKCHFYEFKFLYYIYYNIYNINLNPHFSKCNM